MITAATQSFWNASGAGYVGRVLAEAATAGAASSLVEGPAGQGKTTLLRAARTQAEREGLRVLSAVGAELERDFAYGVVQQLFSPAPDFAHGAFPPLAIIVDDAHWADAGSVKALAVLARRIEGLPVALIIASRTSRGPTCRGRSSCARNR